MKILISALFLVTSSIVAGQRPSFAGFRPIGFPDTPNRTTTTTDPLADRFGEGTTERLPIEANGDRDLIDRLSKLPVDKQPFWFINWQAYEKHRNEPQTYPQRPNAFVDPIPVNSNLGSVNSGFSAPSPGLVGTEPAVFNRFGPTTTSRTTNQLSSNFGSSSNFGGNNYPNSNANLNANVNPLGIPLDNTANYVINPTANPNLNGYPTANPSFNTYTNSNSNSNNYPSGNTNIYPSGITNNYPSGNTNNYPSGNTNNYPSVNSNNYPSVNTNNYPSVNTNNYPSGNTNNYPSVNTNNYPSANTNNYPRVNTNNYTSGNFANYSTVTSNPSGVSNTNVLQSSNFNSQLNSGTTKDGVSYYQTTQNYKWNTSWTTKVSPTNFKYPGDYPQTGHNPQRSGRVVF